MGLGALALGACATPDDAGNTGQGGEEIESTAAALRDADWRSTGTHNANSPVVAGVTKWQFKYTSNPAWPTFSLVATGFKGGQKQVELTLDAKVANLAASKFDKEALKKELSFKHRIDAPLAGQITGQDVARMWVSALKTLTKPSLVLTAAERTMSPDAGLPIETLEELAALVGDDDARAQEVETSDPADAVDESEASSANGAEANDLAPIGVRQSALSTCSTGDTIKNIGTSILCAVGVGGTGLACTFSPATGISTGFCAAGTVVVPPVCVSAFNQWKERYTACSGGKLEVCGEFPNAGYQNGCPDGKTSCVLNLCTTVHGPVYGGFGNTNLQTPGGPMCTAGFIAHGFAQGPRKSKPEKLVIILHGNSGGGSPSPYPCSEFEYTEFNRITSITPHF